MDGISVLRRDLSEELIVRYRLARRVRRRSRDCGDEELHFLADERRAVLPVWHSGQLVVYPWGAHHGPLPREPWCMEEDLKLWQALRPEKVRIVASFCVTKGVWYPVVEGIEGILARGNVYMLAKPSTHYFRTMTRSQRMPVLISQQI